MKVKIVRIDKTLPLPEYHTSGAVAFDLYSRVDMEVAPQVPVFIPANLIIEVPQGFFLMIAARSSLGKRGMRLNNSLGVIDQDYHGPEDELHINLYNFTNEPISIKRGDRLAQGVIIPIERAEWNEVEQIKPESRGGWGSTGHQ